MKVLITGGTTFVSKYAAEYFVSKGHEVTVLNRGSRQQAEGVRLIECDRLQLGNRLRGECFDAILDITAYTQEHIQALLDSGMTFGDYIFISSSAVYPETNVQPFRENQPCGNNSVWGDYGFHKYKAEQWLQSRCPNAYLLRPPYLYGIGQNLYREAFVFDCAMLGRKFYLPRGGDMKLQFFHVADLCRFMEILLQKRPQNHIFNVGNQELITVKDWVTLCYRAVGTIPEFVSVAESVPQRDYFCFYDYEYCLDVSKQRELMPDTIPLEQGLRDEFVWYKDNPDSVYYRKPYMNFIDNNFA